MTSRRPTVLSSDIHSIKMLLITFLQGYIFFKKAAVGGGDNIRTFGHKWGGLIVLGDFFANIDKIKAFLNIFGQILI
jgi:hypothetical protein